MKLVQFYIKKILVMLILSLIPMTVEAVRAKTEWFTGQQPDGSFLTLTLVGDEHFNFYQDIAGNRYTINEDGRFHRLFLPKLNQFNRKKAMKIKLLNGHPDWGADKKFRQLVILVTFGDTGFGMSDPQTFYQRMFNEKGYNYREGAGCVADYFRDQSGGLFNIQFDVYGPYIGRSEAKVSKESIGETVFQSATRLFVEDHPDLDFSPYDWDGNGELDQVIYIYAGFSGNQAGYTDYIWPNCGNFPPVKTTDGYDISLYSASAEHWSDGELCGIGTVCHEFSHCLGLPDIYPTSENIATPYIVDEWDIMDGGAFTNYGWCPPNYSPLEKMLLGWLTPIELTEDRTVENLKPVADGGEAYLIRHTDDEFLLLENRQWKGWDFGIPGHGLIIYHVYYDQMSWAMNQVNANLTPYYSIVAADGLNYLNWIDIIQKRGLQSQFSDAERKLNCLALSSAAYPYTTDSTVFVNNCLTDTSLPSSIMYTANALGSRLLSKPVTEIAQHDDGTISFMFRASNNVDDISPVLEDWQPHQESIYSLSGRKLAGNDCQTKGVYVINRKKVVIRK